jgi:hypothetical protein
MKIQNPFNVTATLTRTLSLFDKVAKQLDNVIAKASDQYTNAQSKMLEAEAAIKKAEKAKGALRKLVGEDE